MNLSSIMKAAQDFTTTYCKHENEDSAMREAFCLQALFPAVLSDIREGDAYAGRVEEAIVGYRYSFGKGDIGYYWNENLVNKLRQKGMLTDEQLGSINALDEFWASRSTYAKQLQADGKVAPQNIYNALLPIDAKKDWTEEVFVANYMSRMCEINLDFDKLLHLGIPGLRDEVLRFRSKASETGVDAALYDGMLAALETAVGCCRYYAAMAQRMSSVATEPRRSELVEMARILDKLSRARPDTFREAIQLYWLYGVLAYLDNYGRMDVYLGDFYAADIDSGRMTQADADKTLQALWRMIAGIMPTTGRIIIGGLGRRNEANADRFALAAMEASRSTKGDSPQLSLRIHAGMNPAVFDKALSVIGEGGTYPILYNDDVHVAALANAFNAPIEDAEQYVMNNCGEYSLDHKSINSPNGSIGYYKLLELTLFDGVDPLTGRPMGLNTGGLASFGTFDELLDAFKKHATFFIELIAQHMITLIDVTAKDSPNLLCSMLFDDCLTQGKGLLLGGRYVGLDIETHSVISVANSLLAIKKLVYDEKKLSQEDLLKILMADFDGYELERRMMANAPKFGNDDKEADDMALEIFNFINTTTMNTGRKLGADVCLASHVGVNANVYLGQSAIASADGRRKGTPLTNSINPLPGQDQSGITALLNSMAKFQPDPASGLVMHLKLGKDMFTQHRETTKSLLQSFFDKGGSYLCIAVMDRGDLERAMKEPEAYASLMVRIGGFSARFVTLAREMQLEILSRTAY